MNSLSILVIVLVLLPPVPPAAATAAGTERPIKVTLHALPGSPAIDSILPSRDRDGRADKLFREAVNLLPAGSSPLNRDWLFGPIDSFPAEEAEEIIRQAAPALAKADQAAGSRLIAWGPPPGPDEMGRLRELSRLIALRARLEMSHRDFKSAARTIGVGLVLAQSLADRGTMLIGGLVGVAIGDMMNEQLLELLQQPDAPGMLPALRALPDPLIDLEPQIKAEIHNLNKDPRYRNPAVRAALAQQLKPAHDRAGRQAARLRARMAAVRLIETIRTRTGNGELPPELKPDVLSTSRPAGSPTFRYQRKEPRTATLTVTFPGNKDTLEYRIELGETN